MSKRSRLLLLIHLFNDAPHPEAIATLIAASPNENIARRSECVPLRCSAIR